MDRSRTRFLSLRCAAAITACIVASCGETPTSPVANTSSSDASGDTVGDPDPTGDESASSTAPDGTSESTSTTDPEGESSESSGDAPSRPPAIGLVQYDADLHFGDDETNLANLTTWAEAAIDAGATIVVFPEGSTYGYASATEVWCAPGMNDFAGKSCRDVSTIAEALPGGPTTDYWTAFAAEHDVTIVFHVPEVDGGYYYTSLGVVGPEGWVTRYRKRSLYYVDQAFAVPGNESVVINTPGGRFGLMICLDGTYDGPYYDEYLASGVDGIIIPMDWDDDPNGSAAAITWFRERAYVNDVPIYAADVSVWDGTGLYLPGDMPRERNGLPAIAIGIDGITVHPLEP